MNKENEKNFVCYTVRHNDSIVYVGEGRKGREKHVTSGCSHVYELNRLHFSNEQVIVEIESEHSSKDEALAREEELIEMYRPKYNVSKNKFYTEKGDFNSARVPTSHHAINVMKELYEAMSSVYYFALYVDIDKINSIEDLIVMIPENQREIVNKHKHTNQNFVGKLFGSFNSNKLQQSLKKKGYVSKKDIVNSYNLVEVIDKVIKARELYELSTTEIRAGYTMTLKHSKEYQKLIDRYGGAIPKEVFEYCTKNNVKPVLIEILGIKAENKKIRQKDLAEILNVSDRTVRTWYKQINEILKHTN
jgi:DNA-binding Lrp family transcriptional regulator